MLSQYDTAISAEWREVCSRVKQELKKLGHDIPLCAHSSVDELRQTTGKAGAKGRVGDGLYELYRGAECIL